MDLNFNTVIWYLLELHKWQPIDKENTQTQFETAKNMRWLSLQNQFSACNYRVKIIFMGSPSDESVFMIVKYYGNTALRIVLKNLYNVKFEFQIALCFQSK